MSSRHKQTIIQDRSGPHPGALTFSFQLGRILHSLLPTQPLSLSSECPAGFPCIPTQAGDFPLLSYGIPRVSRSQPPPFLQGSPSAFLFFDSFAFLFHKPREVPAMGSLHLPLSFLCCEATTKEAGSWFFFYFLLLSLEEDVSDPLQPLFTPHTFTSLHEPPAHTCPLLFRCPSGLKIL